MKDLFTILFVLAGLLHFPGCGTVEETVPEPPAAAPVKETTQQVEFKAQTDTVAIGRSQDGSSVAGESGRAVQIQFMVQIGAFQSPQLGAAFQAIARERFKMPVLNDYHPGLGLYQIRIGFFETREAALNFRARMHREFPEDYKDAWVVQLKR